MSQLLTLAAVVCCFSCKEILQNKINSLFASAFALKGIEYDQVPVNLIKDGGQQVQHHKIRLSLQTVEYI